MKMNTFKAAFCAVLSLGTITAVSAQDKLKEMPGYEQYIEIAPQIRRSIVTSPSYVKWNNEGTAFQYKKGGETKEFTIGKGEATATTKLKDDRYAKWANRPARGRQYASAESPNGKYKAFTKNRNMFYSNADGSDVVAITTEGNEENQLKFGIATWVYGEELSQNTAMWWSPDSKKVAFYKFDEKESKKYYVLYNQTQIQDSVEIEAYPKVGAKNLPVDLLVYDLETKKITELDLRDGKPYNDGDLGTYIYDISWTPDGKELLYHSTNRKQNIMELRAANPNTGASRTVIREEWLPSYTENSPEMHVLDNGKQFIWASERSGFNNYYLYDFSGKLVKQLTKHNFEVDGIVSIDEAKKVMYYTARSGENHMKIQLHSVKLNGSGDKRLTDPSFHHTVYMAPNHKYFVDVAETHNTAPVTNLRSIKGKKIAEIGTSDLSEFNKLGLKKVEAFTFTSADGKTELHGLLHFPSNFDPNKKYPLLLSNYGGPATNEFTERFTPPNALTEFGFLVAEVDGRNVKGRGKRLLDNLYQNLGFTEMDDFAAGIKSLYNRPYFNKNKVGVYGTSYGGTTSATLLLRYPDVFHAAVANSAVTDWRNYDNVYTERYMGLLDENKKGYEASSLITMAKDLEGELMIFFGTSDNNVHPANSLQFIKALQDAGKSFEVQIGPDKGHTAMDTRRMMEFFIEHLVLDKE